MKKKQPRERLLSAFFSLLLAGEVAVLLDVVLVFNGRAQSVPKFAALVMALFLPAFLIPKFQLKYKKILSAAIAAVIGIPMLVGFLCWHSVSEDAVYRSADDGKGKLYADHRVMLLVPHQDDDINVLGGVMEEYLKYGSEVYVVFSTNGDYYDLGEVRLREALDVLGTIGIPEDHVIFLGYGDQWDPDGPHLYNAQSGAVVRSRIGYTKTYGLPEHPAYRDGQDYTIDNFLSDIESVILEYRPDVLYCVDCDYNVDHRATSMAFEKVMGRILKKDPDYRPQVYKAYAYITAWESEKDFYGENLLATQRAFAEPYRWEDRVQLPVSADGLSRSVLSAPQNRVLSKYVSQGASMYGARVINSDKVFWQRETDSLCHQAQIYVSSGKPQLLNDFMLLDSSDLVSGKEPFDGTWIPESSDSEKKITVVFPEPADIREIVLYDHPDGEKNVLNARISFDNGDVVETGTLLPEGAATRVVVDQKAVSSFTVTLLQMQGEAGLTELEAFGEKKTGGPDFVKLMDEEGNFVYDYWMDPSGTQLFQVYSGNGDETQEYEVACSNSLCSAELRDDGILVTCPAGETCIVTVSTQDGELWDSVFVQNPGRMERAWKLFWLRAEEKVMDLCETKRLHERIFVCRLYTKAAALFD